MRGPSQNILYDKKRYLSIYCVNKEGKSKKDTIYSAIEYISTKSIKIKLDKEKTDMFWEKISEKLSKKIGQFINFA